MENLNYRNILKMEYESRKMRNSAYSMRAYAKAIGISSGALSEILQGKRNLSTKKALTMVKKLNLEGPEANKFIESTTDKITAKQNQTIRDISLQVFEAISNTACMGIIALADVDDFQLELDWIASQLHESKNDVAYAINLMRNIGLIELIDGVDVITDDFIFSPDGIPSRAIKNFHHKILQKASDALETQSLNERDISGISFAMDSDDVMKLKKDILNFQKRIVKKYSTGRKDRIYHLESAFFALSGGRK